MSTISNVLRDAGLNALKAGRFQEAVNTLRQAAESDPECFDTWTYLGAAFSRMGDHEGAWHALGRAVQIKPRSAQARFNLGMAHQQAGHSDEARTCFESALSLEPTYSKAQEAIALLPPPTQSSTSRPLTNAEIARLSHPQGELHLTGAQASDVDPDHYLSQSTNKSNPH